MTTYCDTSLLVPLLTPEAFSEVVEGWFASQPQGLISYSSWTETEIASALARKQRSGRIDVASRARGLALWRDLSRAMVRVAVEPGDFDRAATLVDSGARGLRASDALHLAVVLRLGLDLATFDRDLATAARDEGVRVALAPPDA